MMQSVPQQWQADLPFAVVQSLLKATKSNDKLILHRVIRFHHA